MKDYILRRVGVSVVTFFLAITINFFVFRIMPGNPLIALIDPRVPPASRLALIERFGLNRPVWEQFLLYILNLFRGDFGISFYYAGTPVADVIFGRRLFNTVILMGSSITLSVILAILIGVKAASRRGTKTDVSATIFSLVTYSFPVFWIGLLILLVFGYYLPLLVGVGLPIGPTPPPGPQYANVFEYVLDYLRYMVGPLLTLTLSFLGGYFLIMRNTILNIFTEDYMLTARAKGLSSRRTLYVHALKNALLPMISIVALHMTYLVGGATMTETVFSWYGLGLLVFESVRAKDYPVLQGIFLLMTIVVILSNFIADLIYAYLDPRIRY